MTKPNAYIAPLLSRLRKGVGPDTLHIEPDDEDATESYYAYVEDAEGDALLLEFKPDGFLDLDMTQGTYAILTPANIHTIQKLMGDVKRHTGD